MDWKIMDWEAILKAEHKDEVSQKRAVKRVVKERCYACTKKNNEIKDLRAQVRESKKLEKRLRRKIEERLGLQDCAYCEIEMFPNHHLDCIWGHAKIPSENPDIGSEMSGSKKEVGS